MRPSGGIWGVALGGAFEGVVTDERSRSEGATTENARREPRARGLCTLWRPKNAVEESPWSTSRMERSPAFPKTPAVR